MFRDLAVTALSAVMTAIGLYVLVKALDLIKNGANKLGPIGDYLLKALALSFFVVPMLYFFRQGDCT